MFIPEVLMVAHAMGACVEILKPLLGEDASEGNINVVIGTVKGDLHDIGKNLVSMMMQSAGMTVYDLGVDIPPEDFITRIKEKKARLVCLSALLTTTMPAMKQTIDAIVESGYYNNASEVIRDALRFWEKNEQLVEHMNLEILRNRLSIGARQAEQGEFTAQSISEIISGARNG